MLSEDAIREELAGARRGIARAEKNGDRILRASYSGFELALLFVLEEPAQ